MICLPRACPGVFQENNLVSALPSRAVGEATGLERRRRPGLCRRSLPSEKEESKLCRGDDATQTPRTTCLSVGVSTSRGFGCLQLTFTRCLRFPRFCIRGAALLSRPDAPVNGLSPVWRGVLCTEPRCKLGPEHLFVSDRCPAWRRSSEFRRRCKPGACAQDVRAAAVPTFRGFGAIYFIIFAVF